MARYSWAEGMKIAETEAWRTKGKKHATWFVYGRFIPWALAAVALGALGYGAKWAWDRTVGALGSSTDTAPGAVVHSGVPAWVWLAGIVLTIATALVIRRGAASWKFGTMMLAGVGLLLVWIGLGAFALGAM